MRERVREAQEQERHGCEVLHPGVQGPGVEGSAYGAKEIRRTGIEDCPAERRDAQVVRAEARADSAVRMALMAGVRSSENVKDRVPRSERRQA